MKDDLAHGNVSSASMRCGLGAGSTTRTHQTNPLTISILTLLPGRTRLRTSRRPCPPPPGRLPPRDLIHCRSNQFDPLLARKTRISNAIHHAVFLQANESRPTGSPFRVPGLPARLSNAAVKLATAAFSCATSNCIRSILTSRSGAFAEGLSCNCVSSRLQIAFPAEVRVRAFAPRRD